MVNKVEVLGRLGADPDVKRLDNGTTLARISVGTNKNWTDKSGVKQEETSWHNITMFGKLAENAQRILQKGSLVFVEGELKYRTVERDGTKIRYTDINARDFRILTDGRRNDSQQAAAPQAAAPQAAAPQAAAPQAAAPQAAAPQAAAPQAVTGTDDDLPF